MPDAPDTVAGSWITDHPYHPKKATEPWGLCGTCNLGEAAHAETTQGLVTPHAEDEVPDDTRGYRMPIRDHVDLFGGKVTGEEMKKVFHFSGKALDVDATDDDAMRRTVDHVAQRYRNNGAPTEKHLTEGQKKVHGERMSQHGDPGRNMERFAEMLQGYFGRDITVHDAVMIQLIFKICRSTANPKNPDNYDDLEGYTEIARMVVEVG